MGRGGKGEREGGRGWGRTYTFIFPRNIFQMTTTQTKHPQKLPKHKRNRINLLSRNISQRAKHNPL